MIADMSQAITEDYSSIICCSCNCKFWVPTHLYQTALLRGSYFYIWCPNGHENEWPNPEPETLAEGDDHEETVSFDRLAS
jgi:hypothetical protein